jgi:hypothetical protein
MNISIIIDIQHQVIPIVGKIKLIEGADVVVFSFGFIICERKLA